MYTIREHINFHDNYKNLTYIHSFPQVYFAKFLFILKWEKKHIINETYMSINPNLIYNIKKDQFIFHKENTYHQFKKS